MDKKPWDLWAGQPKCHSIDLPKGSLHMGAYRMHSPTISPPHPPPSHFGGEAFPAHASPHGAYRGAGGRKKEMALLQPFYSEPSKQTGKTTHDPPSRDTNLPHPTPPPPWPGWCCLKSSHPMQQRTLWTVHTVQALQNPNLLAPFGPGPTPSYPPQTPASVTH